MAREIITGNGRLAIALDDKMRIRDFYYPMVGLENHLSGHFLGIGAWTEGKFSWLGEDWQTEVRYLPETQVSNCLARDPALGIELLVNDTVHFKLDLCLKKIVIRNTYNYEREIRIFIAQDFHIYGLDAGDTAFYQPSLRSIVHYKRQRYFLVSGVTDQGQGIYQFATGNKERGGLEGTWKDAEDGILSGNPISQGSVDSVISFKMKIQSQSESVVYYWIACGENMEAVEELHSVASKTGVEQLLLETENYWSAWVNRRNIDLSRLPRSVARMYKTSLLIMRMHMDNGGAIIASGDSDMLKFNRDTYAYVWPRDGAIASLAFDMAGFGEVSRLFFSFCNRVIDKRGFFNHKYSADGSLGSSWHALVDAKDQVQLPIQEDETALVLYALWNHFQRYRDMEFIAQVYPNLVIKTSDFLLKYIDESTGLPKPSFNIWEEKFGVFTATVATVYAALAAASKFATVFYDSARQQTLSSAAARMKGAMSTYLYDKKTSCFFTAIFPDGSRDYTADSSLSFVFDYGPFAATDTAVINTMNTLVERLWLQTNIGGMARFENDDYYRVSRDVTGNPWFLCTLWLAKWHIARASSFKELEKGLELISWSVENSSSSGVLAEQLDPFTGKCVSVSPLLWSHAEFVLTVYRYLEKFRKLTSGTETI